MSANTVPCKLYSNALKSNGTLLTLPALYFFVPPPNRLGAGKSPSSWNRHLLSCTRTGAAAAGTPARNDEFVRVVDAVMLLDRLPLEVSVAVDRLPAERACASGVATPAPTSSIERGGDGAAAGGRGAEGGGGGGGSEEEPVDGGSDGGGGGGADESGRGGGAEASGRAGGAAGGGGSRVGGAL
jgi:hypothetical protein